MLARLCAVLVRHAEGEFHVWWAWIIVRLGCPSTESLYKAKLFQFFQGQVWASMREHWALQAGAHSQRGSLHINHRVMRILRQANTHFSTFFSNTDAWAKHPRAISQNR